MRQPLRSSTSFQRVYDVFKFMAQQQTNKCAQLAVASTQMLPRENSYNPVRGPLSGRSIGKRASK